MSLLKANGVQFGQSGTATNNLTLSVPASPDGTIKLARGNSGATTADILSVNSSGQVGIGTASPTANLHVVKTTSQTDIDSATQAVSIINTASDTSGNLTGIRLRQDNVTNVAQGYIGLSSTGNLATRANLIIATPNTSGNSTERLRINSSGLVGIGTTSPANLLHVRKASGGDTAQFEGQGASDSKINITNTGVSNTYLGFNNSGSTNAEGIATGVSYLANANGFPLAFSTSNAERLRIDASGNLLVGKTSPSTSTIGFQFDLANQKIASGANGGASAFFNRNGDDGMIVQIAQDGTVEGTISVSGTTVSYNGGHLSRFSQLPSGQRDPAIKKGTVLSNLDAMCEWRDADGNLLPNEQLNKVKISDVEGDLNTAGVFVNWDDDDQDNPYDLNMAMTGDMIIRIAQGTSVNRGDLLMSAGDGTAKPQGDDIIRSKTIAKVTSTNVTCTYEDGSYCVPCVLMAC